MKKKLNVFCILMLVLKAAQIIIGNVMNLGEHAQAFQQGWEEGGKADVTTATGFGGELLIVFGGLACLFLIIRSLIAFVRFVLNVNRDKVFVWENVPLLRWTGYDGRSVCHRTEIEGGTGPNHLMCLWERL